MDGKGDELDGNCVTSFWTEIVEEFCDTLLSVCVCSEGIDDPHLTEMNSCSESSRLGVSRDEFYILDSASLFMALIWQVKFWK